MYRFGNLLHFCLEKRANVTPGTGKAFAGMLLGKAIGAPISIMQAVPAVGLTAYGASDMFDEDTSSIIAGTESGSPQDEARNQQLIYDPKVGRYYTPTGRLVDNRAIKEHAVYNIPREYISKRDSVYNDLKEADEATEGRATSELVRSGQGARFTSSRDILDNPSVRNQFSPMEREDIDKKRAWNMTQLASQAQTV